MAGGGTMLLYNIGSMAKKMAIDYQDVTSHIDHMGVRGASRENVLRDYLKQLLPQKFAVGNGVITDVDGTQSKQQDFFVYDAFNSPTFLHMDSSSIIPVESVYATIEIKSTLTKETLRQSINNIKSVKKLKITVLRNSFIVPEQYNFILGSVFAYTSDSTIETIAQNVNDICKDIPKEIQPSVICILDKGFIVNVKKNKMNQIDVMPSEQTTWGIIKNTKEITFYLYYLILQQHLNTTINFPPDLLKYAEATHALDNMQVMIPLSMLPDDLSKEIGATKFSGDELRFLGENYQIIFKLLTNQLTEEEFEKTGKSIEDLKQISKRFGLLIQRSFGIAPMMQKELIKTQNQEVIKEGKADCHLDSQPCK